MTQALDAAARAIARNWGYDPDLHWRGNISDANVSEAAEAALRAALPVEPTPEMLKVLEDAIWDSMCAEEIHERVQAPAAYRALRAHLLGEDA